MKYTIHEFQKEFGDERHCLQYIFTKKYGSRHLCSHCNQIGKYYPIKGRKSYQCVCGYQIHPLVGTIFEKSSTSLTLWFFGIYLFSQSKHGVSAKELQRQLGVTYKCAWRMGHLIRGLMKQGELSRTSGTFELDETYYGGKRKGNQGRCPDQKSPIFGLLKRGGGVVAKVVPNARRSTLGKYIFQMIERGSEIMTDEFKTYNDLGHYYLHRSVNHSRGEYVYKSVHTNTLEGFWSLLKRFIRGTHVAVSRKHLQAYVDEAAWRYNHRNHGPLFHLMLSRVVK